MHNPQHQPPNLEPDDDDQGEEWPMNLEPQDELGRRALRVLERYRARKSALPPKAEPSFPD